jgi:hypothetical protein
MAVIAPELESVTTSRPAFVTHTREELEAIAARDPTNPVPLYLLALVLRREGEPCWRDVANEAMGRSHGTPQRVYARALMRITLGDWGGWADHEKRLQCPDTIRDLSIFAEICWKNQLWDGKEDLADKSLVVLPEQGFGDCLQMWRFFPALIRSVATPILMIYPRLTPLARHNFGAQAKVSLWHVKPKAPFDRYVLSMSLPYIFQGLPAFEPLRGPGRRPKLDRRDLPVRAGLCWAGNAGYCHDAARSIPFDALAPLLERTEVEWLSLQVGPRATDSDGHPTLRMPNPPLVTFGDTADLIGELDYVVTADTSVAHLAGLLGVPTYLMLQLDSHWRWGLDDTTPWYPSMRLVRQPTFGDWPGAIRSLSTMLDAELHASADYRAVGN